MNGILADNAVCNAAVTNMATHEDKFGSTGMPEDSSAGKEDKSYDLSFAYYFNWDCPDKHVREAMRTLLLSRLQEDETKGQADTSSCVELAKVRWLLAVNPNTPPPVLNQLAQQCLQDSLLERIAENSNCSPETLARLAFHENPEVRAAVAENGNAPPETMAMLAGDECADVRYRLAENPNTAETLLNTLSEDENPYVAHRAIATVRRMYPQVPVEGRFESGYRGIVRHLFGRSG